MLSEKHWRSLNVLGQPIDSGFQMGCRMPILELIPRKKGLLGKDIEHSFQVGI